jgi:hypothetical protein
MNVSLRAADAVDIDPLRLATAVRDEVSNRGFQVGLQDRQVVFDMPIQLEINLMEGMGGHG